MDDSARDALGRIVRLAVVGLVLVVAASGPVAAHAGDDGAHHHDGVMGTHDGMGWGMGWGAWFLWPALAVLGGVAGYALLARSGGDGSDDALSTLKERYARGDIDDEEFERRRERLEERH
ncbi:SHOCT domain-containing protein [Haloarcula sediminis]|uniref:SHOCT domain-containing protein n=1 Tax=Haloarcula sediminis TaxID=3111777 RepID=UPI002D7869A3|nr:SHOCT domain-containing protein [Haloarcula sp. CK38]